MEVVNIEKLRELKETFSVAIGFFDGVHLGHQKVIQQAIDIARKNQIKSVVMTFAQSPKVALGQAENEGYVTPTTEKCRILKTMSVDYVLVIECDATFLSLTAETFVNDYLLSIGARAVCIGFDFKFGRGGAGNAQLLSTYDAFETSVSDAVLMDGEKVSTTNIKQCLKKGDLAAVNQMLGRPLSVSGEVVRGKQFGRTIGFPTANLKIAADQLFHLRGVYATNSYIGGVRYSSMTNVGYNPTANFVNQLSIETYVFDFDEDIYGQTLRVEFINKMRDEVKFNGLDALVDQLEKDKANVAKLFS
ncbi:MAG: bifunctional riboflavin kinase/FAD synthetase [Turicibacter sp.]|nr:bifunctional riboflavin kinase/FAD synthetase [Turicibacter sp.]